MKIDQFIVEFIDLSWSGAGKIKKKKKRYNLFDIWRYGLDKRKDLQSRYPIEIF